MKVSSETWLFLALLALPMALMVMVTGDFLPAVIYPFAFIGSAVLSGRRFR